VKVARVEVDALSRSGRKATFSVDDKAVVSIDLHNAMNELDVTTFELSLKDAVDQLNNFIGRLARERAEARAKKSKNEE
jgi:predicted sulfurtransferase